MERASSGPARVEEVGRIEHDRAAGGDAELVDQPHGARRRGDDVGLLRLDAEVDVVPLGEVERPGDPERPGRARPPGSAFAG